MEELREGWLYDGLTAVRHEVTVGHAPGELIIVETGERVAVAQLYPLGDRTMTVFGRDGWEGWRLGFAVPPPSEWLADLPRQEHHGGVLDRFGIVPALVGGALIVGALVWVVIAATSVVGRLIPESWEVAFGDALVGDFGGNACTTPAGQQALDRLAARLSGDGKPVRVRVVDLPVVNAVALPGRNIVLFDGLIDDAKSPDEMAGVLSHEIGHVEERHVMTALVRQFGLGLLLGGSDGGAIANTLLTSRYSRSAEHDADLSAVESLRRANISPAPTAGFFGRLADEEKELGRAMTVVSYIGTHPVTAEREALFKQAVKPRATYRPSLTPAEWRAVQGMCAASARPGGKETDK